MSWGLITRLLKDYPQAGNGRLWGYDRPPKGDVGKRSFSNEAQSAERNKETKRSAACVLRIIVIRSLDALFDHVLESISH